MAVMLGASACGDADNEPATTVYDGASATSSVDSTALLQHEAALARRGARMDEMTACIRGGDAATWKQLSLTTDQIRWMEELQGRMGARNGKAVAKADREDGPATRYTFSTAERRKLAEILTDDQLEQWTAMCPDQVAASK